MKKKITESEAFEALLIVATFSGVGLVLAVLDAFKEMA